MTTVATCDEISSPSTGFDDTVSYLRPPVHGYTTLNVVYFACGRVVRTDLQVSLGGVILAK